MTTELNIKIAELEAKLAELQSKGEDSKDVQTELEHLKEQKVVVEQLSANIAKKTSENE